MLKMKTGRTRKMVQCEIVSVDCPQFLINSERQACRYDTASGALLANGHYLAVWPARESLTSYGPELKYYGPYATVAAARMLQISSQWMGIVEPPSTNGCPFSGGNMTHQWSSQESSDEHSQRP
jgi:hypothetical protein